jgi:hypothetical protein
VARALVKLNGCWNPKDKSTVVEVRFDGVTNPMILPGIVVVLFITPKVLDILNVALVIGVDTYVIFEYGVM